MSDTMRVYVATSLDNKALARDVIALLRERDAEITYDWTEHGSVAGEPLERKQQVAKNEVNGVATAGLLVVLLPGGRGTHVEIGVALGNDIPILVLTAEPPGRTVFYQHPRVMVRDIEMTAAAIVSEISAEWDRLTASYEFITRMDVMNSELRVLDRAAEATGRWCTVCGCSHYDACAPGCSWALAEPDVCSECVDVWETVLLRFGTPRTKTELRRALALARAIRAALDEDSGPDELLAAPPVCDGHAP